MYLDNQKKKLILIKYPEWKGFRYIKMARHAHVGFLEKERFLGGVDLEFIELVRLLYCVPGFASYGVSCSGHFYPEYGEGRFYPQPWGHLGLATLPEMENVNSLIKLINEQCRIDSDAALKIWEKIPPYELQDYSLETNLKEYMVGENEKALYIARLEIRIGDNGCLDSIQKNLCAPIIRQGNDKAFNLSKIRYEQIRRFWGVLAEKVKAYNLKRGFTEPDFSKKEFLPFR